MTHPLTIPGDPWTLHANRDIRDRPDRRRAGGAGRGRGAVCDDHIAVCPPNGRGWGYSAMTWWLRSPAIVEPLAVVCGALRDVRPGHPACRWALARSTHAEHVVGMGWWSSR